MKILIGTIALLALSMPAYAQLGGLMRKAQEAQERKQQFDDLNITEEEEIKLGATILRNPDGAQVVIPNRQIVGKILVNSRETQIAETRARLAYGAPVSQALAVVQRTVAGVPDVATTPPPEIGVFELGDYGPVVVARYWIPSRTYFPTRFAVNRAVLDALAAEGIAIQTLPMSPVRA